MEGIIHWRPSRRQKAALIALSLVAAVAIGFVHYLTGPKYEFHSFYLLPVLAVSWFAGARAGTLAALFSVADWLVMDWLITSPHFELWTTLFNEAIRLSVFMIVVYLAAGLRAALQRENARARLDPLTRLANRRGFYEQGQLEISRTQRYRHPFTAMFIDLDNFKAVNDELGHHAGDRVLCAVAEALVRNCRAPDVVGRLGGDEFAVLMPETGREAAGAIAEKLRHRLLETMRENRWPVTFSIGVATFTEPPESVAALMKEADALMYSVKHNGKDRVRHEVV